MTTPIAPAAPWAELRDPQSHVLVLRFDAARLLAEGMVNRYNRDAARRDKYRVTFDLAAEIRRVAGTTPAVRAQLAQLALEVAPLEVRAAVAAAAPPADPES
jgi:P2-related tail formation protein